MRFASIIATFAISTSILASPFSEVLDGKSHLIKESRFNKAVKRLNSDYVNTFMSEAISRVQKNKYSSSSVLSFIELKIKDDIENCAKNILRSKSRCRKKLVSDALMIARTENILDDLSYRIMLDENQYRHGKNKQKEIKVIL